MGGNRKGDGEGGAGLGGRMGFGKGRGGARGKPDLSPGLGRDYQRKTIFKRGRSQEVPMHKVPV